MITLPTQDAAADQGFPGHLVAGVLGHVDHGKTSLVRALTGIETDRLPEERRRGISIALGFAQISAGPTRIDLIDMPGHERFVRTMIAGATGLDAVLLVVAADEGIMPQTTEHVDIAGLVGVRHGVVVVTKCDLASAARARAVGSDARALLGAAGIDAGPEILTSARDGEGIPALRQAMAHLAAGRKPRASHGPVFLPVDRAFSIAGHGTVVTGTPRGGVVAAGDTLDLFPLGRQTRVKAVQIHGRSVGFAEPGQRVALNLRDVAATELARGMCLTALGTATPSTWLTLHLRSLPTAPALPNGARLRALFGAAEAEATLRLLDRDTLEPGEEGFAQLRFASPVVLPAGEPVILRRPSPALTVAGGRVIEPLASRRPRNGPQTLARLEALATLPAREMFLAELERAGFAGMPLAELARLAALLPERARALVAELPATDTGSDVVLTRHLDRLKATLLEVLATEPEGMPLDRIRGRVPDAGAAVLQGALAALVAEGKAIRRGPRYAPNRPDIAESLDRRALAAEDLLERLLRDGGLAPALPATALATPDAQQALNRLLKKGVAVRAHDREKKREVLFHQAAVEVAKGRLAAVLAPGPGEDDRGLLVREVGEVLGISRKYSIPLLTHLDETRFTRRVGDRRVLARPTAERL